ncbi:MAG: lysylphosphatidylglycerol synthase transmembrane domain-containing protein, partial [Myxococcota bacterium]
MNRFAVSFLVANVIGVFFLWLTARTLPLEAIQAYMQRADLGHLALWSGVYVLVYAVCHGARVVRWYDLVRPLADIPAWRVHRVCVVGFAAILLLPLRLGEVVRPYLLARRASISTSAALGTAVVERVIDGLVMTGLLFVTLATYRGARATGVAVSMGLFSAVIFLGALAVCLLAWWRKARTVELVRGMVGVFSRSLGDGLAGILGEFIEGFKGLLQGRAMGRFVGLTVFYWGTNAASMWLLARFGFGLDVSAWDMAAVMALLVLGIMLPSGPAMAGNFEFFMVRALGLFVAVEVAEVGAPAGAFAATVHVLQFL